MDAAVGEDAATDAAASTAMILDPSQSWGGKTYAEWGSALFTWLLELPGPDWPNKDTTGAFCATGQTETGDGGADANNVFFLVGQASGQTVTRTCTIPAGRMIFFGLFGWYDDNGGEPDGGQQTDQELQNFCSTCAASVTALSLEIDGTSYGSTVADFAKYLTVWAQFSYTIPNTPTNFPHTFPGSYPTTTFWGPVPVSFGGGYWILLAPLSAGSHTIHFAGQQIASDAGPASSGDVTYNLTVQ